MLSNVAVRTFWFLWNKTKTKVRQKSYILKIFWVSPKLAFIQIIPGQVPESCLLFCFLNASEKLFFFQTLNNDKKTLTLLNISTTGRNLENCCQPNKVRYDELDSKNYIYQRIPGLVYSRSRSRNASFDLSPLRRYAPWFKSWHKVLRKLQNII